MIVIGLTGGIGSGKTTVANLFAELGVPIIDADMIAREVTQSNTLAFQKIVDHFGEHVLLNGDMLNRALLRDIIFADAKERVWLENLLHPLILEEMEKQIKQFTAPYCIAVIPLLFEVEFYSFINRSLVVDAPETAQVERVAKRDNKPNEHIEAILKTQASRSSRLSRAQDVIINDGDIAKLKPQVEMLHKKYLASALK